MPISNRPETMETPKDSLITRLLITPLTFLSFILSLALISNHNIASRSRRVSPKSQSSTVLSKITESVISILFKTNEQSENPYAYIRKPGPLGGGDETDSSGKADGEEGWYWHNNQKKLLKMEVVEALEIRKWVLVVLLGVMGIGASLGFLGLRMLWGMVDSRLGR